MKKIFALLLASTLFLSACNTSSAKEPIHLYQEVNKKTEDAKSVAMDMTMKMDMQLDGEDSISMNMTGNVEQIILSKTNIEMMMKMQLDASGQKIETTSFFKDDFLYQDVMGQKMKTKTNLKDAMAQVSALNFKFDQDAIIESSVEPSGENKILKFKLDGSKLKEIADQLMNSTKNSLAALGELTVEFGEISFVAEIDKDNNLVSQNIIMDVKMTNSGETANLKYDIMLSNIKINTVEKINFPADLDSYPEISAPVQ